MHAPNERISERLRDVGQGFIAAFPDNDANINANDHVIQGLKGYFFRVAQSVPFYFKYSQLGAVTAGAGNALDFDYLGDTGLGSGNDILRVEDDDFHVMQFGLAPESVDLRVYYKVSPDSDANTSLDRSPFSGPDPTAASNFDYFDLRRVDNVASKFDPPAFTERLSFRNSEQTAGQFLQFGFEAFGRDVNANQSVLHLTGAAYKLVPVTDEETQDTMEEVVVTDPVDPEIPTTLVSVGGITDYNLGTQKPDAWDDSHARVLTFGTGSA